MSDFVGWGGTGGACWWGDSLGRVCRSRKQHSVAITEFPGDLSSSMDAAQRDAFIKDYGGAFIKH
eukprot:1158528-Pelagomonas_calceolata.AAC.8